MRIDVVTLFPEMFSAVTDSGITSRARRLGLWEIHLWNPREETQDAHRTVDDRPYGGGPGMVMLAEPLKRTLTKIRAEGNEGPVVLFSPTGKRFDDAMTASMAKTQANYVFICGRYEGIDERFLSRYVDLEISIGDYVISGGELAAMVVIDAMVRRLPGAIKEVSASDESFATGLLDAPHFTRPEVWEGEAVPEILLGGHHEQIARWTREKMLEKTAKLRPDLLKAAQAAGQLDKKDLEFLKKSGFIGLLTDESV